MITEKNEVIKKRISELETELDSMLEHGFNFSASQIEEEIEKLNKLL